MQIVYRMCITLYCIAIINDINITTGGSFESVIVAIVYLFKYIIPVCSFNSCRHKSYPKITEEALKMRPSPEAIG